ncbi:unnamed protein product [Arabidopsis lyrata]|nr:unnamed protein product [Arabidopsis lyrata]
MLAPSSTEPSNQRADSRSGSLLTLEEISPRTSLKARELSIGPSDAPCLGEASTAHDDYFFSVKLIHLKNGYGFEDLRPSSRPCSYAIIDESSHIGAHSLTAKLLNRSDKPPRSLRSVANRSKTRSKVRSIPPPQWQKTPSERGITLIATVFQLYPENPGFSVNLG